MRTAPGVLRPGLILVGLLLVAANLRAPLTAVGPVLEELRADLGLSSAAASVLIALPLIIFAIVSPIAPLLARRIGVERTIGLALLSLAAGLIARSLPGDVLLWLGTAGIGVGIAILNVELSELVKRDFPGRIGQVTGLYSAVTAVAAAIAAGLAVPIAGGPGDGWRLAIGVWAGLALIAFAAFSPQLRRNASPQFAADARLPDAAGPQSSSVAPRWRSPWRSLLGWQVTAFMGLQSTGYYVLITWLPSIERAAGISAAEAGFHQVLFSAAGIIGSLAVTVLVRRLPDQRPLAVGGPALMLGSLLGIWLLPGASWLWALTAGIAVGISIVTALTLFGMRTVAPQQAASLSGMAQSVGYLFAAASPIAIGALHDATGGWTSPLLVLMTISGLCLIAGLFAGRNRLIG